VLGKTSRQLTVKKTAGLQVPDRTSDGSSSFPGARPRFHWAVWLRRLPRPR